MPLCFLGFMASYLQITSETSALASFQVFQRYSYHDWSRQECIDNENSSPTNERPPYNYYNFHYKCYYNRYDRASSQRGNGPHIDSRRAVNHQRARNFAEITGELHQMGAQLPMHAQQSRVNSTSRCGLAARHSK